MNKSLSENNLNMAACSEETTPPNYVFLRGKRAREEEDWGTDLFNFKEEMKTMIRTLMTDQDKELKKMFIPTLTEIEKSNRGIELAMTQLMKQNEELTKKVEQLENQRQRDNEHITILEDRLEDLQRSSRKTNIEIKNVPKSSSEDKEDLINMVLRLGQSVDCQIKRTDVRDIYRVRERKEGQKNTPIIVEFSSTILKTDIQKKSKAFNIRYKSKLCAKHLGFTKSEDTPIFVSEQLTVKGSRLFFLARDLAKSKGYKFCWTAYGRVYVRRSENSPIILIKTENQVNSLIQAA